jgi:anti-anti-sigma factor
VTEVSTPLVVETDRQGEVVIASLRGELDLATVDVARAALRAAIGDGAERVEVDLAEVTFLDSSGLAVFVELSATLTMAMVRATTPVRRVVETTGLQEVFGLTVEPPTQDFPADAASIRLARRFVADQLPGQDPEWVDLVTLATSELASNCVIHARTGFTITAERTADGVRVAAVDDGEGVPEVQHPDHTTPTGRGLLIVDRLSDEWGTRSVDGRTEVWFRMAAP